MNTKILIAIAIIILISSLIVPFISAKTLVWTQYSDSTSTEFTISQPEPVTPVDDNDDGTHDTPDCPPNAEHPFNPVRQDINLEQETRQITYGDWTCINNKLQRTATQNDLTEIEYGGLCGIELDASEKPKTLTAVIPYIFGVLILLTLIAIVGLLLTRR